MEHTYDFDLAVIGSGPGGQKAAIMAAKLGRRVCVIDSKAMVGGVCVNTGTIPSKTLREAVLYLTGMQMRDLYGASYRVKEEITISDLLARLQHVVGRETEVIRSQLLRNHRTHPWNGDLHRPAHALGRHRGAAGAPHPDRGQGRDRHGTVPARPSNVDFDGKRVLDSDQILELENVPELPGRGGGRRDRRGVRLDVRRAGHPGHLVEKRPQMLDFCDPRSSSRSSSTCATTRVSFRFGEEVASVESSGLRHDHPRSPRGRRSLPRSVMYSAGRQGNTAG